MISTNPPQSPSPGNQLPGKSNFALKTEDFIKMMVTQLQNQDPMDPMKNQDLLAQMSQIGQLQSTTTLQDSIQTMMLQNQIGAAGNLIGKTVQGLDEQNDEVSGLVTSVRVESGEVNLELDSGKSLPLGRVTAIADGPTAAPAVPPVGA